MSKYTGKYWKGASRDMHKTKREEAEVRARVAATRDPLLAPPPPPYVVARDIWTGRYEHVPSSRGDAQYSERVKSYTINGKEYPTREEAVKAFESDPALATIVDVFLSH